MYNEVRVFMENKPGKLSYTTRFLGEAGIDILALQLDDEGQFGVLKILTAEPQRARDILSDAGIAVALNKVACIEIPDKPGSLVKLSNAIEEAGLNVTDAYGCIIDRGKRALFVVKGDDLEAIEAAVMKHGFKPLDNLD
jgi:hypothetical protein